MSSMQLRTRTAAGGIGARKALSTVDENIPRSRLGKNAVSQLEKGQTKTGLAKAAITSENQTARATLGDLSNKHSVAESQNPSKVTKPGQKGVRSGPNSQKKRTLTRNSALEKAKDAAKINALIEENVAKRVSSESEDKKSAEAKKESLFPKPVFKTTKNSQEKSRKPSVASLIDLETLGTVTTKLAESPVAEEKYWDDLDEADADDHLMVSEYVVDIFKYMAVLEGETMPCADYIKNQKELSWTMRSILVDWLIEVHNKFRLLPETLYLAINLMDRFLSLRNVALAKLQLVGITALFIASKYEEVVHPSIKNFLYMADNGYSEEDLLKAERYMLQVLNFSLQYPNPMNFLRRISKAEDYDIQTRTLGKYLMEITLIDNRFLKFKPSIIAAAAALLSRTMLSRENTWNNNLRYYSGGYKEEELSPLVDMMMDYLSTPNKYEAVYKKYSHKKFMKCAIFVRDWIQKRSSNENRNSTESVGDEDAATSEESSSNMW